MRAGGAIAVAAVIALAFAVGGCKDPSTGSASESASASAPTSASASAPASASASAPASASASAPASASASAPASASASAPASAPASASASAPASASESASASTLAVTVPKKPFDDNCTKDDDCVPIPSGRGCCPSPCTHFAFNKKELARVDELACDPPRTNCPSAGGCITHATICEAKKCKVVFASQPGYRERK